MENWWTALIKPIVMYHHIKNDYKRGLTVEQFEAQVNQLGDTVIYTFDDGLKEHYRIAYHLLKEMKLTGIFFVLGETLNGVFNHVHKGHILLDKLGEDFPGLWNCHCLTGETAEALEKAEQRLYHYDSPKVAAFKKFLLKLPGAVKNRVFDNIAKSHNIVFPKVEDYYLTKQNLAEMVGNDMIVGNHTMTHEFLPNLSINSQRYEIGNCHDMIQASICRAPDYFSYPYGHGNSDTEIVLKEMKYIMAVTTENRFHLGRTDCKELT